VAATQSSSNGGLAIAIAGMNAASSSIQNRIVLIEFIRQIMKLLLDKTY
jgi:hypothetical protein